MCTQYTKDTLYCFCPPNTRKLSLYTQCIYSYGAHHNAAHTPKHIHTRFTGSVHIPSIRCSAPKTINESAQTKDGISSPLPCLHLYPPTAFKKPLPLPASLSPTSRFQRSNPRGLKQKDKPPLLSRSLIETGNLIGFLLIHFLPPELWVWKDLGQPAAY